MGLVVSACLISYKCLHMEYRDISEQLPSLERHAKYTLTFLNKSLHFVMFFFYLNIVVKQKIKVLFKIGYLHTLPRHDSMFGLHKAILVNISLTLQS